MAAHIAGLEFIRLRNIAAAHRALVERPVCHPSRTTGLIGER
jgi:hypothetical protein